MKKFLAVILLLYMSNAYSESQYSQRQMCEAIQDYNTRHYCLFRLTKDSAHCNHIDNRVVKDLCIAEYDNIYARCSNIRDNDLRTLCIALQR